jgi:tagatose-1,6-bisphosphate aldolase
MSRLSLGKLRGLQQVANAKGILTVCAIDHRESLRRLTQVAAEWATPWYVKMGYKDGRFPDLSEGWYRSY